MPRTDKFYRVRIRTAADDADALVLTSIAGGTNPYIVEPPTGDGESIDPITGKPTTGSYSVVAADELTDPDDPTSRAVTSVLADVYARQQLIARKVHVETGEDSSFPDTMVVGYVTAIRLITGITYSISIGQSRRIENSLEVFKTGTPMFPATTSLIGGPIFGGFGTLVEDLGGWQFHVSQVHHSPEYIQIKMDSGFDPRKAFLGAPYDSFSTASDAITDYENNYARPYFEPFPVTSDYITVSNIHGHFPGMRVRLIPITNPGDPTREFIPLSEPDPIVAGAWFSPSRVYDNLTRSGESSLWLPPECVDADTGDPLIFTPDIDDSFEVYVYAITVSPDNPLHIFMHPVDLWENLMIEARIAYDDTVLPALKTLVDTSVDGDTILALRITQSYKLADFLQKVIYGPFRLSTRLVDGKQVLFSIRVRDTSIVQTITPSDLRQDETTLFDLDEATVVTAITLKTKRLYLWSTSEAEPVPVDTLLETAPSVETLENADDDIPGWDGTDLQSPTLREVEVGDIPGMINRGPGGVGFRLGPVVLDGFIAEIGDELFQRMGRGAIGCELACLPSVTAVVGDLVTLNLPRLPAALSSQTPVSQRGTPRDFQVIQRTEIPEGSNLKLVDAALETEETEFVVVDPDTVVVGGVDLVAA